MSRVLSMLNERTVSAMRSVPESHPITYRHAEDALSRRRISEDVRETARLLLAACLQSIIQTSLADHADPLPGAAIGQAVGQAVTRAASALAADESATGSVDIDALADGGAQSNGAWLTMGTLNPEALLTGWTVADTLANVDTDALRVVADAARHATTDDDGRTTLAALALRHAGLARDCAGGRKLRAEINAALDTVRTDARDVIAWRCDVRTDVRAAWTDDARELAASAVKRPGMTRNTWSTGDRTTSGPASLVHVRRADGTAAMVDPRNGSAVAIDPSDAARRVVLASAILPAYTRDSESRAADLWADAQEPMGAVAKQNTRKSRRAGGVGGPVVTGRAKPRRV